MLTVVIISILSLILTQNNVKAAFWDDIINIPIPDPRDLAGHVSDAFDDAIDEFENIINQIPDLPILGEYIKFAQCATEAGKAISNPTSTIINDVTIGIKNEITKITECSTRIINAVKNILSDNNKDAYLDLAKGFFDKCSNLNAGAITIEHGQGAAAFVGVSASLGLAIDTRSRNVYAYIAGCVGITSDITMEGGYTISLFNTFNDVAGCSKFYATGGDINVAGIEGGMDLIAVYNLPSENIIARGIGVGVGIGGNPQNVENGYCYTFNPIKMTNFNDFKKDDIINTIPSLVIYKTSLIGKRIYFRCHNKIGGDFINHNNFKLACASWPLAQVDGTHYEIHRALNGKPGQYSFKTIDPKWPNYWIRHTGYEFFIHEYQDNAGYKDDASFKIYYGINGQVYGLSWVEHISIMTGNDNLNYYFMNIDDVGNVKLIRWQDTQEYKDRSTFSSTWY